MVFICDSFNIFFRWIEDSGIFFGIKISCLCFFNIIFVVCLIRLLLVLMVMDERVFVEYGYIIILCGVVELEVIGENYFFFLKI